MPNGFLGGGMGPRALARMAAATGWWAVAGQACAAAYQPKGAVDLPTSYINLANPGTDNAAPGVAPTFAAATGWTFVAASGQFLSTGVTPTATWTAIIRIANLANVDGYVFGAYKAATTTIFGVGKGATFVSVWNGNSARVQLPTPTAGVFAIAGARAYRDGADCGITLPADANAELAMFIGALNQSGSASNFASCDVLAFAAYDAPLTAPQVAALSAAMAAL